MNKNLTTKKKAFLILACMWFIVTFSVIQDTYAKYVTNVDANANIAISYWNILVNSQDILENSDLTGKMIAVLPGNDYAKTDVIVPGATGYFDLSIDSSKVTLPFTVTITTGINENSSLKKDFIMSGYSLDNGTTITNFENNETSFSHDILKDVNSTTIRVYTKWIDDGLDSVEDTALGITGGKAIMDVNLEFSQITEQNT